MIKKFVELFKCLSGKLNIEIQRALPYPYRNEKKVDDVTIEGGDNSMEKILKLFKSFVRKVGKQNTMFYTSLFLLFAILPIESKNNIVVTELWWAPL